MISITITGARIALAELTESEKLIKRARISALNKTATSTRRKIAADLSAATGIKRGGAGGALQRMKIKKASRRYPDNARIIPSSSGIEMVNYKRIMIEPLQGRMAQTAARAYVPWYGGKKVVHGFVNPAHGMSVVYSTITSKGKLDKPVKAFGPSIASAWKAGDLGEKYSAYAEREFVNRFIEEINKRR